MTHTILIKDTFEATSWLNKNYTTVKRLGLRNVGGVTKVAYEVTK